MGSGGDSVPEIVSIVFFVPDEERRDQIYSLEFKLVDEGYTISVYLSKTEDGAEVVVWEMAPDEAFRASRRAAEEGLLALVANNDVNLAALKQKAPTPQETRVRLLFQT